MNRRLKKKVFTILTCQYLQKGAICHAPCCLTLALLLDLILPAALAVCVLTASLVVPIHQRACTCLWSRTPSLRASHAVRWRSNSIHLVPLWWELITEIILAYVLTSFLSLPNRDLLCFYSTALLDRHSGVRNSKVSNGTIRLFHLLPCQSAFARARSDCELLDCFPEMSCCLVRSEKINTHISKITSCLASLLAVSAEGPRNEWTMSKIKLQCSLWS